VFTKVSRRFEPKTKGTYLQDNVIPHIDKGAP